jgi:hypothetical protein
LNDLQADLDAEFPDAVQIVGVNDVLYASGNDSITDGRDLPWLMNTEEADIWNVWGVVYRDVWVLDAANVPIGIYNLSSNTLADEANYAALRALFVDAMGLSTD